MAYAPCVLGRPHRDGRRVLCFADWSREYGVPSWFNHNGYVQDVSFCRNRCLKCPDILEVKLEGTDRERGQALASPECPPDLEDSGAGSGTGTGKPGGETPGRNAITHREMQYDSFYENFNLLAAFRTRIG